MSSDQMPDRPMSEQQWQALFRESDLKAAKFGELLETLHDEPNHELIIAREMGWTRLVKALEEEAGNAEASQTDAPDEGLHHSVNDAIIDAQDDALDEAWLDDSLDDEDSDEDSDEPWERRKEALSRIPAYAAARALASRNDDALRPLMEGKDPDDDLSRLLGEAYISAHQAAVNIAGGDAMGYDDDTLCGNIVKNRMSIEALGRCAEAWSELQSQGIVSEATARPILAEIGEVRKVVEDRISDLRSRVWW